MIGEREKGPCAAPKPGSLHLVRAAVAALAAVACLGVTTPSHAAGACEAGADPARAALERQVAAIARIEIQRQCSPGKRAGFFSACRDLALRRKRASARLNRMDRVGAPDCVRTAAVPRKNERAIRRAVTASAGAALYCVRPADGYYFPAPRSQFAKANELPAIADQCRFICDDPAVELYRLADIAMEAEEMVSVAEGRPYRDLPAAFAYRTARSFEACDHSRYHRRVAELRARTFTPGDLANAVIPLPSFRPDRHRSAKASGAAELHASAGLAAGVSPEHTASIRKVRIVLPSRLTNVKAPSPD